MIKESHVYVLDDNNSDKKRMDRLLRVAGFNVHPFVDLFLNKQKPNDPVTLIMDLSLTGLSINSLIKELKHRQSNLKIIVLYEDDDLESLEIAYNIGADGFFRKPVDGNALIDAVNWSLKK